MKKIASRKLAHGVLGWGGLERRTNRYGSFYLSENGFQVRGVATPTFDHKVAKRMQGKRVRLTAKVVDARDSDHVGDLFLKIVPSRPEVGEVIDLGVGMFDQGSEEWTTAPKIILQPGDGRTEFWIDPRKLYRLHDQTVDLFIEETTDDFTPRAVLETHTDTDATLSAGNGYIQVKGTMPPSLTVYPTVERLGGGMFRVVAPGFGPVGSSVRVGKDD